MYKRVTPRDLTEALNYNGTFEDMDRFHEYAYTLWELENDMEAVFAKANIVRRDTAREIFDYLKQCVNAETETENGTIKYTPLAILCLVADFCKARYDLEVE